MVAEGAEPKAAANWLSNEYFGRLNKMGLSISSGTHPRESASTIVQMVSSGTISGKIAKDLTDIVWREGGDPRALVETRGLRQVTDESAIEAAVAGRYRGQSGQGGRSEGESRKRSLVCRSGHESDEREGEIRRP
jgi:Asp-tRNA(Asn)/Glu-tRNA(Gln) amidotransferase B subunit